MIHGLGATILILNLLDWAVTKVALTNGEAEGNPLMAWLYAQGAGAALIPKIVIPIAIWVAAARTPNKWAIRWLVIVLAFYVWVVTLNIAYLGAQ